MRKHHQGAVTMSRAYLGACPRVRLLILTLLALVIISRVDHHHEQFALVTGTAYGVIAAVALMLAWRRIFHPARWKTYEFSRLYP